MHAEQNAQLRDRARMRRKAAAAAAAATYFGLCVGVEGLVRRHVELRIKHVLDQTPELHKAVGLQVVQRDVV